MALNVDIQFANALRTQVRNFKVKSNNPYTVNFSCPLCGDSSKNKSKARGYIYTKNGRMSYFCHNCGESLGFSKFLQRVNPTLFHEYRLQSFKATSYSDAEKNDMSDFKNSRNLFPNSILDEIFDRCDNLDENHEAVQYLRGRMIPENRYSDLYYINNIADISELNPKYVEKMEDKESRIVFPLYNSRGVINGLSCRAIGDAGLRYVRIKFNEHDDLVFGLERLDKKKTVYVTEGEFDSLFPDNAIAMGNSALHLTRKVLQYDVDAVLIYDNQPRNPEICKLLNKGLEHFSVVIWPESLTNGKDINEMIQNGMTHKELMEVLEKNTYSGLSAKLAFSKWRKC